MPDRKRWPMVWLFAVLPLLGWWMYGLLDLDEGFYGAVTAEMNRRGEWITPFFNGSPWFEKPILLYWLAKPCLLVFGEMVGPRMPSVLATVATYSLVAWFVRKHFNDLVAQLAVLILSSSLLVVAVGRMMLTDAPLVFCLTGALFTFWESLIGDKRWRILSAGLVGFGILAKGPVAAILFLLIVGWTYWREPPLRPQFKGKWLPGIVVLVGAVASWYVPAYLVNGKLFVDKFLIEQNVGRFTGGDAAHTLGPGSLPFYIPIMFLGMFPWSLWIWKAWPRREQVSDTNSGNDSAAELRRYLATWAAVVFIFFTISGAKLPHYVLPVFAPLAVLLADYLRDRRWAIRAGYAATSAMFVIANVGFSTWYGLSGQREAHDLIRYVKRQGGDVALYELGRLDHDRGTGKIKLQETDLPSIMMYLDHSAIDTGKIQEILDHKGPIWIFTRTGRIQPDDFAAAERASRKLEEVHADLKLENFALFHLR